MLDAKSVEKAPAWHHRPGVLARFITDLIADEMSHLRPGGAPLPPQPWPLDLAMNEQGLGLDSLELLSVASALNEALHLHESGIEDLLLARHLFGEWIEIAADGLAAFDAELTFRTSGSSGSAKSCVHALANLQQEVDHLATLTAGAQRVLTAVPAHHIYGFLFTVLLPERLGCEAVVDVRRHTPQALAQLLRQGDLLISHPAHWALMARHAGQFPPGVHGITSTAPCPDAVARNLAVIGLDRLTQIYGSSETAGIGTRNAPNDPYQLMPFWSRDTGDSALLLRTTPEGTVFPHAIQDRLEWPSASKFQVRGRLDEAVQVGGTNVFPAHIREVLLGHPQVADAAVRLMEPEEGTRLKAFIVPVLGADRDKLLAELWTWTEARLGATSRPKAFTLGDSVPRNAMGKLAAWQLGVQGAELVQ
ncbi:4-coumarate--CoA ligase [Hydrogenophaga sp. RAC07]|uniref:4-coumarate--CoA ligase n=1 Tax=Hydrogenophaga sp. RAC07 TaxID=1842537 RepID=UPI00083DD826|nr:4-coumarate--CoA ligase [Hydrogenophaga sp. RAC07]AOF87294.1 4-coumarate--CoA ligase [Hydrogenophaga sp. RAC07]